jgi:hypothetical protein
MAQVTTSVTISFGGGSTSDQGQNAFSAEVDARKDGFNKGNTNFYFNDTVYVLLYKGSNVGVVSAKASSGNVSPYGSATITKKDSFRLTDNREIRTSAPVIGTPTVTWYGTSYTLTRMGEGLFVTAEPVVATGEIEYATTAEVYTVSGVAYPEVVVFFSAETTV